MRGRMGYRRAGGEAGRLSMIDPGKKRVKTRLEQCELGKKKNFLEPFLLNAMYVLWYST